MSTIHDAKPVTANENSALAWEYREHIAVSSRLMRLWAGERYPTDPDEHADRFSARAKEYNIRLALAMLDIRESVKWHLIARRLLTAAREWGIDTRAQAHLVCAEFPQLRPFLKNDAVHHLLSDYN